MNKIINYVLATFAWTFSTHLNVLIIISIVCELVLSLLPSSPHRSNEFSKKSPSLRAHYAMCSNLVRCCRWRWEMFQWEQWRRMFATLTSRNGRRRTKPLVHRNMRRVNEVIFKSFRSTRRGWRPTHIQSPTSNNDKKNSRDINGMNEKVHLEVEKREKRKPKEEKIWIKWTPFVRRVPLIVKAIFLHSFTIQPRYNCTLWRWCGTMFTMRRKFCILNMMNPDSRTRKWHHHQRRNSAQKNISEVLVRTTQCNR